MPAVNEFLSLSIAWSSEQECSRENLPSGDGQSREPQRLGAASTLEAAKTLTTRVP